MNLIMTKINNITIQKEIDKKKCSIEISSPTNLGFSTDRITTTNVYGQILSETKLHWRDMFADGVQLLIEGTFEDTDSSVSTIGIYDMLNDAFIEMGD